MNVDQITTEWRGLSAGLSRVELHAPLKPGVLSDINQAIKLLHFPRMSILLRAHGGMLRYPLHEVLDKADLASLHDETLSPQSYVVQAIQRLEHEVTYGALERAYVTAMLLLAPNEHEVWVWNVGPNGVFTGTLEHLILANQDLRIPGLRNMGYQPERSLLGSDVRDKVSSVFCIGSPDGYQSSRLSVSSPQSVVLLDRGAMPLHVPPQASLSELTQTEAGWQHGLPGYGLLVTCEPIQQLPGWSQRLIPFGSL